MNLSNLLLTSGVVQNAFRGGGFACIDVGHDANVAILLQGDAAFLASGKSAVGSW